MEDKERSELVQKVLSNDKGTDVAILYFEWMIDEFWGNIAYKEIIPNAHKTHAFLIANKHSEKNKFSFNDADDTLYYLSVNGDNSSDKKVFVHTTQSRDYIYIFTEENFHVRRVFRSWRNNSYRSAKEICGSLKRALHNIETLSEYHDDGAQYIHRPSIEYYKRNNFHLQYQDMRDPGYVMSYKDFPSRYGLPKRIDCSCGYLNDIRYIQRCAGYIEAAIELE